MLHGYSRQREYDRFSQQQVGFLFQLCGQLKNSLSAGCTYGHRFATSLRRQLQQPVRSLYIGSGHKDLVRSRRSSGSNNRMLQPGNST